MDLKKKLILLSDQLDRAGLSKEANLIDLTLKLAIKSKFAGVLENTFPDEDEELDDATKP